MNKKAKMNAMSLFWSLAEELMAEDPSVVEGTIMSGRCLRVGGEFLALADYKDAGLVVKLSRERVAALVASGIGQPFAPAGRVFKEWVSIPKPDRRRWRSLLREGVRFVRDGVPVRSPSHALRARRQRAIRLETRGRSRRRS